MRVITVISRETGKRKYKCGCLVSSGKMARKIACVSVYFYLKGKWVEDMHVWVYARLSWKLGRSLACVDHCYALKENLGGKNGCVGVYYSHEENLEEWIWRVEARHCSPPG